MKLSLYYSELISKQSFSLIFGRAATVGAMTIFVVSLLLYVTTPVTAFENADSVLFYTLWVCISCSLGVLAISVLHFDIKDAHIDYLKNIGAHYYQIGIVHFVTSSLLLLCVLPVTFMVAFVTKQWGLLVITILCYFVTFCIGGLVKHLLSEKVLGSQFAFFRLSHFQSSRFWAIVNKDITSVRFGNYFACITLGALIGALLYVFPSVFWLAPEMVIVYFGFLFELISEEQNISNRDFNTYYEIVAQEIIRSKIFISLIAGVLFLIPLAIVYLVSGGSMINLLLVSLSTLAVCVLGSLPILDMFLSYLEQYDFISINRWLLAFLIVFIGILPAAFFGLSKLVWFLIITKKGSTNASSYR